MIRVIIADDQVILRESLKELIEHTGEITVVRGVANGIEAFECCKLERPDVILMDVRMPVCDGIEGTRLIKQKFPNIKIIILTTFADDSFIAKALRYGAEGYILKDIEPELLIEAIKSVFKGLPVIHKEVIGSVVRNIKVDLALPEFSKKEIRIIEMIVQGKNNKAIGDELNLSEGRVRNIITDLFERCNVKDRTQLAVYAVRNNLVQ